MPRYRYVAYRDDERQTALATAESETALLTLLRHQGYLVTKIQPVTVAKPLLGMGQRLSLNDKITLAQNLATFLRSGVPIVRALELTGAEASPRLAVLLESVSGDLRSGASLAKSLARFPNDFDPVFLALVEAGEATGKLTEVFKELAGRLKSDARTLSKVRSAFVYPSIVFAALLVLGLVLAFFVLPRITGVFARFDIKLPLATQLLIAGTKLLNARPILSIAGIIGLSVAALVGATSEFGRRLGRYLGSRTPGIRQVFWNLDLERFTSTLWILVGAGVPIQRSLAIAARTISNPKLAAAIPLAAERLGAGRRLSDALAHSGLPTATVS